MSLFKEDNNDPKTVETIIGPSVKVEGNFIGEGNVMVDGIVNGSLKTNKDLKIGKGAKIKAEVEANNVIIAGEVKGNIKVKEKTEVTNTARVFGNIETKLLSVEAGALLNGKCTMSPEPVTLENKKNSSNNK